MIFCKQTRDRFQGDFSPKFMLDYKKKVNSKHAIPRRVFFLLILCQVTTKKTQPFYINVIFE